MDEARRRRLHKVGWLGLMLQVPILEIYSEQNAGTSTVYRTRNFGEFSINCCDFRLLTIVSFRHR